MKKLLILILFLFISACASAQTFVSLQALRDYINTYIRNSAVESFTNMRLNRSLNGVVDFIDATNSSSNINNISVGNGVGVAITGTRNVKSMTAGYGILVDSSVVNQVNYRADSSKLFSDFRKTMNRKVDTLFKVNDTLIRGLINGDTFSIVIKGVAGIGNSNAGSGYKLAYPNSDSIRSLRNGYGIVMDSSTVGEIKISSDTTTLFTWSRNNIRKVDTIYAQNDTTLIARIMGVDYSLVIRGKASTGNTSVGSGFRIAINGTTNIKSITNGYGILLDSLTSNQVNIKTDTATLFATFRGIINSSSAITALTGDVVANGPGSSGATIQAGVVSNSKLRNSVGLSVIGRATNTSGSPDDIAAGTDGHVLKRSGTSLTFGFLDSNNVTGLHSESYYNTKYSLANSTKNYIKNAGTGRPLFYVQADSVKIKSVIAGTGMSIVASTDSTLTLNSGAITGLTGDVSATGPGNVSGTINALAVTTGKLADNAVSNQKFRQSAAYAVVGNSTSVTANVGDIAAGDSTVLRRIGTTFGFGKLDSAEIPLLHSQGYYDGRYDAINSTKNYIKNSGIGVELGYLQVDTFKVKRVQAGSNISITRNSDSSLTLAAVGTTGVTSMTGDVTSTGTAPATVTIQPNVVSNGKFRKSAAYTVVGNNTTLTDTTRDITANDTTVLRRLGTSFGFAKMDSVLVSGLHSEGYYNTKYTLMTGVDDRIKNIGTGTELSFNRNDSAIIKRIQAGSLISISRNADSSITITGTGDGVGATGLSGDVVTSGTLPTLTTTIQPNVVTSSKFRQSAAYSVVGNGTSATATVTDVAATDSTVLRRLGTSFGFAKLDSTLIGALHSEGYYNTKYTLTTGVDDRIKNIGTGVELSFNRNDSAIIKRVQAGTLMSITRNADSSLTISSTGDGTGITSLNTDVVASGTGAVAATIQPNVVTAAKFRQSAAYSVVGNGTSALANVTDVSATTDSTVLRRLGTSFGFAKLDSILIKDLHSEGYYNGKYIKTPQLSTYLKLIGAGTQLGYQQVDTFRLKRIQAGTGITITSNTDSSLTITNSASSTAITALTGEVTATGPGSANALIAANAVTDAKLRTSAAYSVIGRSAATSGNVADITAVTTGHVLRLSGGALGFGLLDSTSVSGLHTENYYNTKYDAINATKNFIKNAGTTGYAQSYINNDTVRITRIAAGSNVTIARNTDSSLSISAIAPTPQIQLTGDVTSALMYSPVSTLIGDNRVSDNKLRQSLAWSIIGRSGNTGGNVADITATTNGQVLRLSGTTLGFGTIDSNSITNNSIGTSKMADYSITGAKFRQSAPASVVGRYSNTQGDVYDIQATQDYQVLNRKNSILVWSTLDSNNVPGLHSEGYYSGVFAKVGGSNTQIQFNNNGVLGGSANYIYEKDSARTTFKGNVPLALLRDTNTVYARQTSVQSRKLVVNDTANTTDNGYITQIYKDSTNRALYVNGNIRLDNTQRGTASDSLFLLKGTDSVLRQSAVKTINGVSILGSGNIVTANNPGAAGGSNNNLQYNSSGTLAGTSNINLVTNPTNSKDLVLTEGLIFYPLSESRLVMNTQPQYILGYDTQNGATTGALRLIYNPMLTGTYTPTLTNGTNVTTSGAQQCYYQRMGNYIYVWGSVTIQPTTYPTNTDLFISLPVLDTGTPANTAVQQLVGTGSSPYENCVVTIIANGTNPLGTTTANMKFKSFINQLRTFYFSFSYYATYAYN